MSILGVQEVSTTTGTDNYTLLGATPNSFTFAAKVPNGTIVTYEATDGARSEYGWGRFEHPSTLHRLSVINSSNDDAHVAWPATGQRIISLVADPFPPGGECGQILVHTNPVLSGHPVEWQWRPYPIAIWVDGTPRASQVIRLAVTEHLRIPALFAGSCAYLDDTPDSNWTVTINRVTPDGTVILLGSVLFAAATGDVTWSTWQNSPMDLDAGDRVEFQFPVDPDEVTDVSITLRALIVCDNYR